MLRKAFTLVEVMVAMVIMVLALTATITAVIMLKGTTYGSSNRLEALHDARDQMETLLSMSYTNASLSEGIHAFSSGNFTGVYSVVTNSAFPGIKTVALTVYWRNPGSDFASSNVLIGSVSSALN